MSKSSVHVSQSRNGLSVGDRVTATDASGYAGCGVGVIQDFLNNPRAANNGAALVEFFSDASGGVYIDTVNLLRDEQVFQKQNRDRKSH